MAIALRYAARTDLGLGPKSRNEDSGYAGPHLLVLADGMGGHAAGDVASSLIVGQLAPLDGESIGAEQALPALEKSVRDANSSLRRAMDDDPKLRGMGSTTIAMLRTGNKLAMAHIGDSRAYLLRDGALSQITKDHSFVQQLVDEHRITPEEAEDHPQRSLVTRVMTGQDDDEPDLSMRELRAGDRYLLCSDGLSDFVRRDIIEEILSESPNPSAAADRLIEVALKASARDNVTVVVADVVDLRDSEAPSTSPQIVGAASLRDREGKRTRGLPISPAEKAASLARSVRAPSPDDDDDGPVLAEEPRSRRVIWVRRVVLAFALAMILAGGGLRGLRLDPEPVLRQGVRRLRRDLAGRRPEHRPAHPVPRLPGDRHPGQPSCPPTCRTSSARHARSAASPTPYTRVETLRTSATDCRGQAATGVPVRPEPGHHARRRRTTTTATVPVTPTDTATTSVPGLTAAPTTGSTP